jgi:hypothetical protein
MNMVLSNTLTFPSGKEVRIPFAYIVRGFRLERRDGSSLWHGTHHMYTQKRHEWSDTWPPFFLTDSIDSVKRWLERAYEDRVITRKETLIVKEYHIVLLSSQGFVTENVTSHCPHQYLVVKTGDRDVRFHGTTVGEISLLNGYTPG